MNSYKQNLIKETTKKAKALLLDLQEPLINEFSKIADLDNICRDISYNLMELKIIKKAENYNCEDLFNNKNGEKKCQ